jgi:hypothetical protein
MKYLLLSVVVFAVGCGSGSTPQDTIRVQSEQDATSGDLLDSGVDGLDASVPRVPVLGTGTTLSDATVLTMPVGVEYFTTDAGTFAYYPDASNSLCPIPTTYLCVNFFFALCLNDVYTSTPDPCNFNPDGAIEVWTPEGF